MAYIGKARNWCFTHFGEKEELENVKEHCTYLIFQKERCPTTKKEHFQGYVEFKENLRLGEVKKRFNISSLHLEPRRGTQEQAINYCKKEDTKVEGPFIFGKVKEQGKRSDIDEIYQDIKDDFTLKEILENHGGNALRMIHAIEKATLIHHGFSSLDSWIKLKRKEKENKLDKLDEVVLDKLENALLSKN